MSPDSELVWQDKDGSTYKLGYSQKLQQDDLELKRKILAVGRIGIILLAMIVILVGLAVTTGLLSSVMRNVFC